jgi:vacuolar iron transporter family protein
MRVNNPDDFDYLPVDQPPSDARVPSYPRYDPKPPPGRAWNGGQGYPPANGRAVPGRSPVNGHTPPNGYALIGGYTSANGYTAANGHAVANGRVVPGYPPPNGRIAPGYPPPNGRVPDGRVPDGRVPDGRVPDGRVPDGRVPDGRGVPGYPPASGRAAPRYQYRPADDRHSSGYPANGRASANPSAVGKHILSWLPFGHRLVLLPKVPEPSTSLLEGQELLDGQELREHRDVNGGWLRPAVFGAMDGLVTNSSLIAGVGGGGGGHATIVLTGIAGLIAGAFSMATGEYISVTSQNDLTASEVELERLQHLRDPVGKRKRLTELFINKGVSPNLAEAVVRQISADRDRAVATHVREELGIDPDDLPSPRTAAVASFAAFTVGALIPLGPFLIGVPVLTVALGVAGLAAIVGGAAVAKLTERSMLAGGLRQFVAAFLATGMAFLVGHLVGARIM